MAFSYAEAAWKTSCLKIRAAPPAYIQGEGGGENGGGIMFTKVQAEAI